MKNIRKTATQDTAVANEAFGTSNPPGTDQHSTAPTYNDALFCPPPQQHANAPRLTESPEEEAFRSLLKSNLSQHKAPQALLHKIRSIAREQ
jgi:hypothetical protein